jgi:pimeloyl-ACP methyl ester carboxylesterase
MAMLIMGYSMGGWIGLGLAATYPARFHSIVVGGIGPHALSPEPSRFWREPMIEAMKGGMEDYCQRLEAAEERKLSEYERAGYLELDHEALIAMLSVAEEPDFVHTLADSNVHMLMYVGELDIHHDSAKDFCGRLQNAQFLTIPGRDHGRAAELHDYLATEIIRFLEAHTPDSSDRCS